MDRPAAPRTGPKRGAPFVARSTRAALALSILTLTGCEAVEEVQDRLRELTPYEAYQAALVEAGLTGTALARDWLVAGRVALDQPILIAPPFREEGVVSPDAPDALGYRVRVPRGQKLTVEVAMDTGSDARVFVDLFRVPAEGGDVYRPVLSSDGIPAELSYEPWREGEYIVRIQPELLRGGRYDVTLRLAPQLSFPVEGYGTRAVQSRFGVDRDGGRRSHDGVDIFARRGTPVLAASAGLVNRVGLTNLGGKVVWVRDPVRNSNIYYAHLDSQVVGDGELVEVGDTLGFVGNTGNARTTPPHLHFGIYRRGEGPVDPFPFIDPPRATLPSLTADLGHLGRWVRVRDDGVRIRTSPGTRSPILREVERYTPLRVVAGSGDFFRVRLPDGAQGYVAARVTEPADHPLAEQPADGDLPVRVRPDAAAPAVAMLDPGAMVPVLGRFESYLLVEAPGGARGWVGARLED